MIFSQKTVVLFLFLTCFQQLFSQKKTDAGSIPVDTAFLFSVYEKLHFSPELSGKEYNTSRFLKKELEMLGYAIVDSLNLQSFAGVLQNGKGPTILYRTELDGLPLTENTNLPFSSAKNNSLVSKCMHACGHDIHMTTWLSTAIYFAKNKNKWKGTLVFLAQSSEETGKGAKAVLESPNFKKIPVPDYQIAIHNTPELNSNQIGFCNGYAMGSVDMIDLTFYGMGGHGAKPDQTIDPILLSSQFVTGVQAIVSRNLPSTEPAVITVGSINGGSVGNIIPDSVELKMTVRCYSPEIRNFIFERIVETANGMALASGLDSLKFPKVKTLDVAVPSVYNDPILGDKIRRSLPTERTCSIPPTMIGEDFSFFIFKRNIPSYLIWLGTKDPIFTQNQGLHKSDYLPDYKNALTNGADSMIRITTNLLSNSTNRK